MMRQGPHLLILCSLMLGGCVSLFPDAGPPPTLMVLGGRSLESNLAPQQMGTQAKNPSHSLFAPLKKDGPFTVKVSKPIAPPHLTGRNVAVRFRQDGVLKADVLENIQWESPLPSLLQGHIVRVLDQSGAFDGVGSDTESFDGTVGLQVTIYDWYVLLDDRQKPTHVRGAMGLKLLCTKNGHILGRMMMDRMVPVSSPDGAGVQGAFNDLLMTLDTLLQGE